MTACRDVSLSYTLLPCYFKRMHGEYMTKKKKQNYTNVKCESSAMLWQGEEDGERVEKYKDRKWRKTLLEICW